MVLMLKEWLICQDYVNMFYKVKLIKVNYYDKEYNLKQTIY